MTVRDIFSGVIDKRHDFSESVGLLRLLSGDYCLLGGLAVNCFVEPVFTADADFTLSSISPDGLDEIQSVFSSAGFEVSQHRFWLNIRKPGSALLIQITTDDRYFSFPSRAVEREIFETTVKVASLPDIVQSKLWAYSDPERKMLKREKDRLDLLRIAEHYPEYRPQLPDELKDKFQ